MGCNVSKDINKNNSSENTISSPFQGKRFLQLRAPILLFYLPSNVREVLTLLIASHFITSESQTLADKLNIRFIDIQNQRSARRHWLREFSNKPDYAAALYISDIRDRSSLLMNARTLNWFLKLVLEKYNLIVVVICSNEMQLVEFQNMLYAKIEPLVLSETNPETVINFVEVIKKAVVRYNSNQKNKVDVINRNK